MWCSSTTDTSVLALALASSLASVLMDGWLRTAAHTRLAQDSRVCFDAHSLLRALMTCLWAHNNITAIAASLDEHVTAAASIRSSSCFIELKRHTLTFYSATLIYLDMAAWSILHQYAGPLLALSAAICFTFMDALAQSCMRHGLGPGQVATLRNVSVDLASGSVGLVAEISYRSLPCPWSSYT